MINLYNGDCLVILKEMEDNSVDSVVTDPPYGISFMAKNWDYEIPSVEIWQEVLRVLKPGGHLLSFASTRTQHRMCCNIEDAGFEIRDTIAWVYGQGFPKNHDISKAIDKKAGAKREVIGKYKTPEGGLELTTYNNWQNDSIKKGKQGRRAPDITSSSTEEAKYWDGWGTALKPSHEPITLARKPLSESTIAANVLKHGTGGINIDGCRIETKETITNHSRSSESAESKGKYGDSSEQDTHQTSGQPLGRFPANLIHNGSDEILDIFPANSKGGSSNGNAEVGESSKGSIKSLNRGKLVPRNDSGSAARFFYCAKTSKKERGEGNNHPTVKPLDLMKYLVRLVTPPDGIVLDPFMGSGSTGIAAKLEGFSFIGIEMDEDYFKIAEKRINESI